MTLVTNKYKSFLLVDDNNNGIIEYSVKINPEVLWDIRKIFIDYTYKSCLK